MKYIAPQHLLGSFNCPYPNCNAYSEQTWSRSITARYKGTRPGGAEFDGQFDLIGYDCCCCYKCKQISVWKNTKLIFPITSVSEPPNEDMPEEVMALYQEAAKIVSLSPKASAAILRLALQKLLELMGYKGNINTSIRNLVKRGLPIEWIS